MNENEIHSFRREASIFQHLSNHPNVARFCGIVSKSPELCIITEYYPWGSLYDLLITKKVRLTFEILVHMARDISAAIWHAHKENVIHRDIALRNVLVGRGYHVYVSDFGMARIRVASRTHTKSNLGAVKWLAPEVLRERSYSEKSDVYSFGVLLFEMMSQDDPYSDKDLAEVAMAVAFRGLRPSIPQHTPPLFASLMQQCWLEDGDLRPNFQMIYNELTRCEKHLKQSLSK